MGISVGVSFQTMIMDAKTGNPVKINPKRSNLVLDTGLNALAKSSGACCIGDSFAALRIGGGTNPNSYPSGTTTFTQSATTVTASAAFFSSSMVGGILKYGTGSGGTEQYITGYTSTLVVTVSSSATVAATIGTVWMVQQNALQSLQYSTATYRVLTGDNSETYSAGQMVLQRTYVNGVQSAPYTVNELGWNSSTGGTNIFGRIVLPSSDVIGTSNFYVVILQMTVTFLPNAPAAVANVGTGINTAGNIMIEWFNFSGINADGSTNLKVGLCLDQNGANLQSSFITANYVQQTSLTSVAAWPLTVGAVAGQSGTVAWTFSGNVGICTLTAASSTTTTGQTCYGISLANPGNGFQIVADVQLTTPVALPNGVFIPTTVWQMQYARTLTN